MQKKATEQYFPMLLFMYYALHGGSNYWVYG